MDMDSVMDEFFAAISGDTLEVYRADDKLHSRISNESRPYIGTPSSEWPPIHFNWDLTKKG